jgi:glycosyltransferase involved in cell wall biosynthesis
MKNDLNIITTHKSSPKISVITVVFNGEKYIESTILSVINQNYSNIEYIIIDGDSSDGTIDQINKKV